VSVRLVYLDGQFLPEHEARLSLHDAGFVWGATATDRVRTYGRKLFRLADHIKRFRKSCQLCYIPQPIPDDELTRLSEHLVEHNGGLIPPDDELVLIMFATPGERSPTLGLMVEPLDVERYQALIELGARLVTPPTRQLPKECIRPQAKVRSRLHWWIAEREAREIDPESSALLQNVDFEVTETATANFLIVRGGMVMSPLRSSILNGISLDYVQKLCAQLGIPFAEAPISVDQCLEAREAILTSTSFGICGVSSINRRPIPWPGGILRRLHAAWSESVGVDIWRDFRRRG